MTFAIILISVYSVYIDRSELVIKYIFDIPLYSSLLETLEQGPRQRHNDLNIQH